MCACLEVPSFIPDPKTYKIAIVKCAITCKWVLPLVAKTIPTATILSAGLRMKDLPPNRSWNEMVRLKSEQTVWPVQWAEAMIGCLR